MSAKHTPGPWRVEDGTTLVWGACLNDDETTYGMGYPVALAQTLLGSGSPFSREFRIDEAEANARLIAAAPELLSLVMAWNAVHHGFDNDRIEFDRKELRTRGKAIVAQLAAISE
jgi:hypothetical protein